MARPFEYIAVEASKSAAETYVVCLDLDKAQMNLSSCNSININVNSHNIVDKITFNFNQSNFMLECLIPKELALDEIKKISKPLNLIYN